MPLWSVRLISLVGGLSAIGTGIVMASVRLHRLKRLQTKRHRLFAAMPEGWGTWFALGFCDLTIGTGVAMALAIFALWIVLGVWLASVGLWMM